MKRDGFTGFTIEAVAREASVARMTVYYQFGSKIGLLEALCDTLAANAGLDQLATAFHTPDPHAAIDKLIDIFGRFWESDRLVARRLRGLAAIDPEFEQVVRSRDERRRKGLTVMLRRLSAQVGLPAGDALDDLVQVAFVLTSFETFDMLAGPGRSCAAMVPTVQRLVRAALGL
jgi:AcrR family transcriptional regulator